MNQKIILLLVWMFSYSAHAVNHYYSSVSGDDLNDGLTSSSPKESVSELLQILNELLPGDTVFLERGSVWYQTSLTMMNVAGTEETPIVFTTYGNGENPVFSGQKKLSNPIKNGDIYTFSDSDIPDVLFTEKSFGRRFPGYVTIGGTPYLPSRYPDEGYLKATSSNRLYITDTKQSWNIDQWKDGWAAIKCVKWNWSVVRITSSIENRLYTTEHSAYTPFGPKYYYILNASNAMNLNGEWVSNNDSLSVFWNSETLPEVKVSTVDRILTLKNSSYIHFSDIDFVGANIACIQINNGSYNKFDHCRMIGSGEFGVLLYGSGSSPGDTENNQVTYCEIADCCSAAIYSRYCRAGIFTNNYIHRIAINSGYQNLYNNTTTDGPYAVMIWNSMEYKDIYPIVRQNFIDSVQAGVSNHYNGYTFQMRENFIRNYGIGDLSDLGGFYSTFDSKTVATKKYVNKNFFLDVHAPMGAQENYNSDSFIHAIYTDQEILGVKCDSNSIENADIAVNTNAGIGRTFNYNNILWPGVHNNGVFRNSYLIDLYSGMKPGKDTFMYNNVVLGKDNIGYVFLRSLSSYQCALPWKGSIDNNKWFNPTGANFDLVQILDNYNYQYNLHFDEWQLFSDSCSGERIYPARNSSYNNTRYETIKLFKNWSSQNHVFKLDAEYVDVDGNVVTDSVDVEAFFSKLLFQVSGNENQSDLFIDSTLVPQPIAVSPAKLNVTSERENKAMKGVNCFPVPVNNVLNITMLPDDSFIEVFDAMGNKLTGFSNKNAKELKIDFSGYKAGVYFFRVLDMKRLTAQKLKIVKI